MSEQTSREAHWQAVIVAHPLESQEAEQWLRYGVALSQLVRPSDQQRQQQQQAGLAFAHAEALGAPKEAVARSQRQSIMLSLANALELADAGPAAELLRRQQV